MWGELSEGRKRPCSHKWQYASESIIPFVASLKSRCPYERRGQEFKKLSLKTFLKVFERGMGKTFFKKFSP